MSQSQRTLAVGVLVIASFAAGWWLSRRDVTQVPAATNAVAAPATPDTAQTAPRDSMPLPMAGASSPPVPSDSGDDEASHDRESAAQIAKNESRWSGDPPSPTDASAVEKKFLDAANGPAMDSLPFLPTDYSVACRKGMCRVESVFPVGSQPNEWVTRLQLGLGGVVGNVATFMQPQPDGTMKVVMYAYRLGTPMPP